MMARRRRVRMKHFEMSGPFVVTKPMVLDSGPLEIGDDFVQADHPEVSNLLLRRLYRTRYINMVAHVQGLTTPDGLRLGGPTIEQWVAHGYLAAAYPPRGWAVNLDALPENEPDAHRGVPDEDDDDDVPDEVRAEVAAMIDSFPTTEVLFDTSEEGIEDSEDTQAQPEPTPPPAAPEPVPAPPAPPAVRKGGRSRS